MRLCINFRNKRFLLTICAVVIGLLILRSLNLQRYVDVKFIREILTLHWYLSVPTLVLLCSIANITNTPATFILTSVVLVLGKWEAVPLIYLASTCACLATFAFASSFAGDTLPEVKSERMKKWIGQLENRPITALIVLRTFFQFMPLMNYALAMSKLRFRDYFIGTLVGMLLPSIALAYFYEWLLKVGKVI